MSWQGYVDNSLIGTGKIDRAAIFSAAGDSVWAVSPGFAALPDEVKALVDGFQDAAPLYSNGLYLSKEKFTVIKADDRSIYGRKDKEGLCAVKTKQAIVVGHYPDGVQPGEAAKVIEQLADYLIGVGY